jgi:sugar lactone lactonase YvrE
MLTKFAINLCLILAIVVISTAQEQPKDGRYYESLALKAYEQKNFSDFLSNMKLAAELRPNHPRLMYNLAGAYSLNAKPSEAIAVLRKAAGMGLVFALDKDTDFDALRALADFKSVQQQFVRNQEPKIHSTPAFTVQEKGLVPESVAYDASTEKFYLSSVYRRKILSINKSGEVSVFASESDGLWSVMGIKVDSTRHLLWVCTTAHPQMSNFKKEDEGSSALLKFDLRTGKLLSRYQPSDKTKRHWLGDLAINSQGDVFATDSVTPAVYVLRNGRDQLETLVEGQPFVSLQGLDFSSDQAKLFVADYSKGIFIVDLTTKQVRSLDSEFTLLGIDGLYSYKGSLLAVQNGVNPHRVVRIFLNKDQTGVARFETLEANNPVFDEPTLGVVVKDSFYFVANSQWGAIDRTGRLAPEEKLKEPTILKLKL